MRLMANSKLTITSYSSDNDILIYLSKAYSQCAFIGKEPPFIAEIEDNFSTEILDSGKNVFSFDGMPIDKYSAIEMTDFFLEVYAVEHINYYGDHMFNAQINMFEEL